jgi:RNA polymerase sigma-70 factor (ECF subfamily)
MEIADRSTNLATETTVDGVVPGAMDDLVERPREGSGAAFEALVRRHDRRLLSLASRLTGRLEDAQEVAQESFSRLYKNLKRFQSDDEVGPWLRVVTVNLCRDLARRKARSPIVMNENLTSRAAVEGNPERAASDREREQILRTALQGLTERERTALVLRELEGLNTLEAAEIMGVAAGTVRVQVMQARLKLRKLLEKQLGRQSK